ncbi:MAG: L-threonylcarbamoyladenylate synthase [Trueperaceae bacterium]
MPRRLAPRTDAELATAAAVAADVWRGGGLVAFPTETVYGLGAAARDDAAVAKVFRAKGRPSDHPLIVHLADASALERWAVDVPAVAFSLARAFWPGPLTMVLRRNPAVPSAVTGGQATIAVRVPDHPVALALLRAFGDGVAAPSANRFGHLSPTRAQDVLDDLSDAPGCEELLVVDGGPCGVGIESTIVDLTGERPLVRRPGHVGEAALAAVAGEAFAASGEVVADADVRVPGALARHYAPRTPARRVAAGAGDRAAPDVAVLARRPAPSGHVGAWSSLPDHPIAAAAVLYASLRALDAEGVREVWVEDVPDTAAWRAVADRLARATHATTLEEGP